MPDTIIRLDPEIIIGADTINRAGALCSYRGRKVLVATELSLYENNHIERLLKVLEDSALETILFDEVHGQATAELSDTIASLARGARCDIILGFGGLKTQYIAKLACILAASDLGLFDVLDGRKEESACLSYAAIPVAGGDPFLLSDKLVAIDPRDRQIKMIKCPRFLSRTVVLDPSISELISGDFAPTAAFDGFCCALEAYCSVKSNFFSDALLEQAISLYAKMILTDRENITPDFTGHFVNAELLMALGASVSTPGIGTALAYSLNSKFPVAKSWCATILLPYVMEKLIAVRPEKMAKVAAFMGDITDGTSRAEAANMSVDIVRRRMGQLSVPARLKDFDLPLDRLFPVAEAARGLEFVASSPWTVSSEDAYDLLKQAF